MTTTHTVLPLPMPLPMPIPKPIPMPMQVLEYQQLGTDLEVRHDEGHHDDYDGKDLQARRDFKLRERGRNINFI